MAFLATSTRRVVLEKMRSHLVDGGRLVIGLGAGRGYEFDGFFEDVEAANFRVDLRAASWDLRGFNEESEFLVAALSPA